MHVSGGGFISNFVRIASGMSPQEISQQVLKRTKPSNGGDNTTEAKDKAKEDFKNNVNEFLKKEDAAATKPSFFEKIFPTRNPKTERQNSNSFTKSLGAAVKKGIQSAKDFVSTPSDNLKSLAKNTRSEFPSGPSIMEINAKIKEIPEKPKEKTPSQLEAENKLERLAKDRLMAAKPVGQSKNPSTDNKAKRPGVPSLGSLANLPHEPLEVANPGIKTPREMPRLPIKSVNDTKGEIDKAMQGNQSEAKAKLLKDGKPGDFVSNKRSVGTICTDCKNAKWSGTDGKLQKK